MRTATSEQPSAPAQPLNPGHIWWQLFRWKPPLTKPYASSSTGWEPLVFAHGD
ncbi:MULTISPECIES: hypothetical protein [Corynebacterium]|uniref:Alpha/beta hydrolase n=1 Tax=Corynebacterium amycolatum TaxID=43765 RepID=A0AAW9SPY1_CORAY|nr:MULTISPECIES: hypothetical protein [Corynebacterium]MDK7236868.1 hypothetical protein [Corynebacterium amycolatum]MDK7246832.1 hypothetical protein [Corynebacterium amycolatum]